MTPSFEAFAARKTADASGARIPGFTTEFDRASSDMVAIGNEWTRRLFDGPFHLSAVPPSRYPGCSLVFVQSNEGNTGARNPSDLGGGETDKHLIYEGLSRVAADAVLAGAETIRAVISFSPCGTRSSSRCGPRSGSRVIQRRSSRRCAASTSTARSSSTCRRFPSSSSPSARAPT